ncbi:hypothetical protein PsorP6_015847 [Peronosclerospora sorghi]|uniref:Uncharacterized protein n=1 Tax=Peronosclerospora sorghi TaxID=230839 RepID=A0ACC0WQ67_9STRA|nr:hypothetical protein PsorP6_015847 [Peronosclerospora sorghi]
MTGDSADFVEYSDLVESIWVTIANGQRLESKGRGSVRFVLDGERTVKLTDVLFLPQLGSKLVSVSSLTVHGAVVQFEQHRAVLQVGGTVVATVPKAGKLFEWRVGRAAREEANVVAGDPSVYTSVALWHARLGHVSGAKMKMVASACYGVPEFGNTASHEPALCNGCALGKMTTSPFSHTSGSKVKTQIPFELVHSDVMGPIKPVSKGGAKYIVTFIDEYTRMV